MSKSLIDIFLFSLLISFTLTYSDKSITYTNFITYGIEETDVEEGISYIISYERGEISNNYIKITIKPNDENQYLYAYYSPISQKREDAYLLNKGKGEFNIYINKAFTKSEADGFIYLTIACFDSNSTFSFKLSSLEMDYIDLLRNSQYSFFTTNKKNLVNSFKIEKNNTSENDSITFWASGNKNILLNVTYVDNTGSKNIGSFSFSNGKYSIFEEKSNALINEQFYYIIEVSSPANSLITVGNNVNMNNMETTKYSINSNEIYGVLTNSSNIQCFDFEIGIQINSYLSIMDFNKNIKLKIIDKEKTEVSSQEIKNGNLLFEITENYTEYYFCLERNNQNIENDTVFSLQVTYDVNNNYYKNVYSPQINGFFYERHLEKGQIAFFTGLSSLDFKTELRYYLKKNSGYPEMYFVKCKTFPNCKFDINKLPPDSIKPKEINDMFSYSIFKTETTTLISPEQYVLLVHCNGDYPCSFQTNIYSELDQIVMQKDERTYHTIMSQGENNFVIKLEGESDYKRIFVNFLTYSGDISIKTEGEGFRIRDFLAGNKKYYVFDFNSDNYTNFYSSINKEIYFHIKGELPSFYSADYKLIYSDNDKIKMFEESGINYLETIEPKVGNKTISLSNRRLKERRNFAVNFFSINCEIGIKRKISEDSKELQTFDFLAQDVISNTEPIFDNDYYNYLMEIKKMDNVTQFDMNWCMVYVSSIEQNLDNEKDYQKRYLLISEGVINRVILNQEMPKIEYIYPHMNPTGYVVMNLNWQTNSKINISIYIENILYKEIITSQSQYIIIQEKELRSDKYCPYLPTKPNQVCSIVIQIKLDNNFYNDEPIMEFSIKSQEIVPAFIRKSMLRKDIIVGNYFQYFYTEVGNQEEGHINIKFDRGSGKVYGRIVEKNKDEGSGWMDRIILPDENNNELTYNYFTKKIFFGEFETEKCDVGCYLLIKVEPNFSDDYYKDENIAYPISLSINSNDAAAVFKTQDLLKVVDIPLNEFIVGDTVPLTGRFGYFYSLFIPYDCEALIIEFLCESSFIYVNVGDKKPLLNESDFSYKVMDKDGILKITKEQILSKMPSQLNANSIKNVELTIAIGAQFFDDEASSVYSFRIRALREKEIELISLSSDQETLCNIEGKKGNCYFIIPYNRLIDSKNNIFFHAVYLPNVDFNYYANEIPKEKIANRDQTEIQNLLPKKENNKWSNTNSKGNYLYIDNTQISDKENSYIVLNLEINSPYSQDNETTVVTLLHTLYSYQGSILPNPSSAQLFLVNNNNLNNLDFKFDETSKNLLIRIKAVSGFGVVYWDMSDDVNISEDFGFSQKNFKLNSEDENIYYYLKTPGDTITLTLGKGEKFPLHFTNLNPNKDKADSNESPGFGFYTFYEREAEQENYNYLEFSENSLYNFKDVDFPFIFYSKLSDTSHEIDVNIKLLSLTKKFSSNVNTNFLQSSETEIEIPSYDEFTISGIIEDEKFIYSKHVFPEIHPDESKMFKGICDPLNKLLKIQFTPEIIKSYNVQGDNYIYVQIDKNQKSNIEYSESSMEISVIPSNNDGFVAEMNKFIYGKIPFGQKGYSRYELSRINSLYKFMKIEFSVNYDQINYAINSFKLGDDISKIDFYNSNIEFNKENYNGKTIITIEFKDTSIKNIYLSIFINKNTNTEKQLSNFVFRYEVSEKNNFIKLKPEEQSLQSNYDRSTLNVTLPTFDSLPSDSKVNYIAKLIPSENIVKGENLESLALIESKIIKIYKMTQTDFYKNESMELLDIHNDKEYYILISCEVVTDNFEEIFSFKHIIIPQYIKEETDRTLLIVLVSVISGFIVIGIVFVVIFLYLRRGNLKRTLQLKMLTKQLDDSGELPTM